MIVCPSAGFDIGSIMRLNAVNTQAANGTIDKLRFILLAPESH
jgi:hypothetical protein